MMFIWISSPVSLHNLFRRTRANCKQSIKNKMLAMIVAYVSLNANGLKHSIKKQWIHGFNPKTGLQSFKQRLLSHGKVEFFKVWQLKISSVSKMKSFESNSVTVIPPESSLSCLISAFGLGFNAWPYQHFIEFQHQQFSLCKKNFKIFFNIFFFHWIL